MTLNVVLVDDDDLIRRGLSHWLSSIDGIKVVGEAGNAEECLAGIEKAKPDIALIDIVLPGISGIELMRRITKSYPSVKCVILSGSMVPDLVFEAFSCGAYGYLPKLTSPDEVKLALENVAKSNWYLSPVVAEAVLKKAIQLREIASGEDGKGAEVALTDRERELLKLLAEGNTFTEIARKLDINARSVERMKSKLEEKIQATNIVDLVRKAIKLGLINP